MEDGITQVKKGVCTGTNTFLVTDILWNLLIGLRNLAVFYVRSCIEMVGKLILEKDDL